MRNLRIFRSKESAYWYVAHPSTYPDMSTGCYQLTSMLPIDGEETPVGHNVWRDLEQATLSAIGRQAVASSGVLDLPTGDQTYKECKA